MECNRTHGVEKQTYVDADDRTRSALTYDLMQYQTDILCRLESHHQSHMLTCDQRFKVLEAKRKIDTAVSAGAGFFGGFVAMAAKWIFGK